MSQKWAKVMAILALAWIIISVIWTSLLYFLETGNQTKENSPGKTNSWTTVQTWTTSSWATSSGTVSN